VARKKKHPPVPPPQIPTPTPELGLSQHQRGELRDLQAEILLRRMEALKLYEPQPKQDEFHACMSSERLAIGGNRCLGGDQEIYDPVAKRYEKVKDIKANFHVLSSKNGEVVVRRACRPFVKGIGDIYRVHLTSGSSFLSTLEHRVHTSEGWASVFDAHREGSFLCPPVSTSGISPSALRRGACRSTQKAQGCLDDYSRDHRQCDEQPLQGEGIALTSAPSRVDAPEHTHARSHEDALVGTEGYSPTCLPSLLPATHVPAAHSSAPSFSSSRQPACTPCSLPSRKLQAFSRQPQHSAPHPHTASSEAQHPTELDCVSSALQEPPLVEKLQITALELIGQQEIWDFTVEETECYFAGGVLHHNSGKSVVGGVEVARAATGQDPYEKYPKENLIIAVIGKDWRHIGLVCYPMLFKCGAIKMIRDEVTNEWRAYRPKTDARRSREAKPAQPLIPNRFVKPKGKSWLNRRQGYIQKVELINGTVIHFFSSEGDPPQGFQADLIWIDEDVNDERWVGEMQARLADRKGRFIWSAMPHSENDALIGLKDRAIAAEENGDPNPIIKMFILRHLDNPYIDDEEKKKNIERWSAISQDELMKRAEGEFMTGSTLMYPTFNRSVHVIPRSTFENGNIPDDWTRYCSTDPGWSVATTLFFAVPPDESYVLFYDEIYIRNCNAEIWGEAFLGKALGKSIYAGIFDMHGGRLRDIGGGRLPHELYSEQLKKGGFSFRFGGTTFIPGCDDPKTRANMVREKLHIRPDGTTKLKVLEGSCPNLLEELKRYRKKTTRVNGMVYVTDEPQTRGDVHACQALEYAIAYEPKYHQPPRTSGPKPWWKSWMEKREARNRELQDPCILLGPARRK